MSAYVIGQLKINNPGEYQAYLDGFLPSFERHGGELLATSSKETRVLEGKWALPRTVLMRFPSLAAAQAWYEDPEYQALCKIRHRTADANLVVVEGV
ncbi:MAG: DUF1330 domain-containing protein [Rhizobiaceae bacterium]